MWLDKCREAPYDPSVVRRPGKCRAGRGVAGAELPRCDLWRWLDHPFVGINDRIGNDRVRINAGQQGIRSVRS
jgi:hypothetical protein